MHFKNKPALRARGLHNKWSHTKANDAFVVSIRSPRLPSFEWRKLLCRIAPFEIFNVTLKGSNRKRKILYVCAFEVVVARPRLCEAPCGLSLLVWKIAGEGSAGKCPRPARYSRPTLSSIQQQLFLSSDIAMSGLDMARYQLHQRRILKPHWKSHFILSIFLLQHFKHRENSNAEL